MASDLQQRLSHVIDLLFAVHRDEILRDRDWWFGTDHYDFNFYDWEDNPDHMSVTVYDMTGEYFEYSEDSQIFSKNIYVGVT